MRELLNAMRGQAIAAMDGRADPRNGLVESYDPGSYSAKVALQPDGVSTGWIPVGSPWVGNGWGMFAPPSPGDLVEISHQEGDPQQPQVGQRFYNDDDRPLPCPSGEFWLVHKSGSMLKFHNDGSVDLKAAGTLNATAATANVTASGAANVTAPAITLGAAGQSLLAFVTSAFQSLFNNHTHTSSASGSPTSAPNQAMGSGHMTSTVRGG